jgi:hypothetical protein
MGGMSVMRTATCLLAGIAGAGCASGEEPRAQDPATTGTTVAARPAATTEADGTVGCRMRSEPAPSRDLADQPGVGVSVAVLPGARFRVFTFDGAPARSRLGGRRVWTWKTPVALTAEASVVVSVAASRQARARLGFTPARRSFENADRSTRFTACSADTPQFSGDGTVGPETGWGGSLITRDRRLCLRLRVESGGRTTGLLVPLGRSCG